MAGGGDNGAMGANGVAGPAANIPFTTDGQTNQAAATAVGLVGASCSSNDPNHLCLGIKYVSYLSPSGDPAVTQAQAAANIQFPKALTLDGVYGSETEKVMNACNPASLLMAIDALATEHYRAIVAARPAAQKFLAGWITRAQRIPEYNPEALRGQQITAAQEGSDL